MVKKINFYVADPELIEIEPELKVRFICDEGLTFSELLNKWSSEGGESFWFNSEDFSLPGSSESYNGKIRVNGNIVVYESPSGSTYSLNISPDVIIENEQTYDTKSTEQF